MFNPYLEVALAGIIWGSIGIFVKFLQLPSTTITFFRLTIPTVILLIYFLIKKEHVFTGINIQISFASLLNGLRMYFYFLAYSLTSIGNGVIMLYTWPIFTTLISVLFYKEKISSKKLILLVIAFVGILLIFSNKTFSFKNNDFVGMISMLVSSIMYAITIPIFKNQLNKFSLPKTILFQNIIGAILIIPFIFINKPIPSNTQLFIVSFYAVVVGLFGFILFFAGLRKLKASTASVISYIEVLSAMIFAFIFIKEVPTPMMIAGGALILTSSFLVRFTD